MPNKQACRLAFLLRRDGTTLAAIADELNAHGYRTRRGKLFQKSTVHRLLLFNFAMLAPQVVQPEVV